MSFVKRCVAHASHWLVSLLAQPFFAPDFPRSNPIWRSLHVRKVHLCLFCLQFFHYRKHAFREYPVPFLGTGFYWRDNPFKSSFPVVRCFESSTNTTWGKTKGKVKLSQLHVWRHHKAVAKYTNTDYYTNTILEVWFYSWLSFVWAGYKWERNLMHMRLYGSKDISTQHYPVY